MTYAQFVPTMFIRLLRLPEAVRRRYDVSSLRTVAHSAAPCPVEVKRQMIDWFGPVIYEYYSATEAAGHVSIGSQEWLEHPGSVGRVAPGSVAITDESGRELPAGQDGIIWFTRPANKFSYHNDPEKSASMFNDRGWARMGDLGHLDGDGYLFITGRSDHTIISGGVNIYPREIEDLLIAHPAVDDVAVIGVPDDEYGESVMAVVTVRDGYAGGAALERDIIDWTRARLAHYKCPRSVTFVDSLPRSVAGKMMKHRLIEQLPRPTAREGERVMHLTELAREHGDKPAVIMADSGATLSYAELERQSNKIAHLFRARGLRPGDHIAVLMENRLEFFPVVWAAQRSGLFYTPVNWHLSADEAAYIVADCGARLLVSSERPRGGGGGGRPLGARAAGQADRRLARPGGGIAGGRDRADARNAGTR